MSGIPKDAPIFQGIVCTDCGHKFDAARLLIEQAADRDVFRCPKCLSDQIDYALMADGLRTVRKGG